MMNRIDFEVLAYLEKNGQHIASTRRLSDVLCVSNTAVMRSTDELISRQAIKLQDGYWAITDIGLEELEPYRVKRCVIMAAGFGSRMLPATADRPKPMVSVNGRRIIETLIDAMVNVGITDITIIRGYKKEKFDELLPKYPFLKFIDNDDYSKYNNIASLMLALDLLDGCYLCEADLYIYNPDIITKYQYCTNTLGAYSLETDDWCYDMIDGHIANLRKVGQYCYNEYGISYLSKEDCAKLREDIPDVFYHEKDGTDAFWEFVPYELRKEHYKFEIRPCKKSDIIEIDNYYELQQLDPSYK